MRRKPDVSALKLTIGANAIPAMVGACMAVALPPPGSSARSFVAISQGMSVQTYMYTMPINQLATILYG